MADSLERYEQLLLIRRFEERLLELFSLGKLNGTTHTCLGQEATAVATAEHLGEDDLVFASHRCHGHYLARFGDVVGLLAEIMGRAGGVCGGRGGSQHLCRDGFFSNGIQGGYLGVATGMAFAEKRLERRSVVVAFIGDGTLGEGATYEALNLAAVWQVPLLVVVEYNGVAQTTPTSTSLSGSVEDRFRAFAIPCESIESTDVEVLTERFGNLIGNVRENQCPRAVVVRNVRLGPHSKGDDHRPAAELAQARALDPLTVHGERLSPAERDDIEQRITDRLRQAEQEVENQPLALLNF